MKNQASLPRFAEICDLFRQYGVSYAALFGSRAFGDNKSDSDYDILVEFAPDSKTTFLGMMKLQGELEDVLGKPVDLVTREDLSQYFRDEVLKHALPFYAAKN